MIRLFSQKSMRAKLFRAVLLLLVFSVAGSALVYAQLPSRMTTDRRSDVRIPNNAGLNSQTSAKSDVIPDAGVVVEDESEWWLYKQKAYGNEPVIAEVEPSAVKVREGEVFVLSIAFLNVSDLLAWDVGLRWDSGCLNLMKYELVLPGNDAGELVDSDLWVFAFSNESLPIASEVEFVQYDLRDLSTWNNSRVVNRPGVFMGLPDKLNGAGKFRLFTALLPPNEAVEGDITLVNLVFEAIASRETQLDLYAILASSNGAWIPSYTRNCTVTILPKIREATTYWEAPDLEIPKYETAKFLQMSVSPWEPPKYWEIPNWEAPY